MKLWGGRFEKETDRLVFSFTQSLSFDRRLLPYDIRVTRAHARVLGECGVLDPAEMERVLRLLEELEGEAERGEFGFSGEEDVHTAVERRLVERLGETGGKLRTARSRNEQVSADLRLMVMEECGQLLQLLGRLMEVILEKAEDYLGAVMPGYTHLQPAQPVLLSHHLLAYFEMFKRDAGRFLQARRSADACPLGSGALAGVTFPLDRRLMAEELGFSGITANSMDAVSDRDFVLDFLHACVMVMSHLSRLGEEVVLWCSPAFGFAVLDEAFATGSSMMPQKMNPDVAELVRAKGGRVLGSYVALAQVLKGLPLTYNRDLQEDKENLFDALDQVKRCLRVMAEMLSTMEFRTDRMREAAGEGYTNATDLADYLARKGLPFLRAHEVAGRLVRLCHERGIGLAELPLEDYRRVEPAVEEDVYEAISLDKCVEARDLEGGTAPSRVEEALREARDWLEGEMEKWVGGYLHLAP